MSTEFRKEIRRASCRRPPGRTALGGGECHGEKPCESIEEAADLIVECVGDSSEGKDTVRLKDRYTRAGIREYWIVDARRAAPSLTLLTRGRRAYRETPARSDGFTPSAVLGLAVRLVRLPPRAGLVRYR